MNGIEFEVTGRKGLFTCPEFKVGGEKCTLQIPTYEALKGITKSIYWKPTITWVIDAVRIMNPIRMESTGIILPKKKSNKKVRYRPHEVLLLDRKFIVMSYQMKKLLCKEPLCIAVFI